MLHGPLVTLTATALKAYVRNRTALFWNVLIPLIIMGIFGLLNFGGIGVSLGVVDQAHNDASNSLITSLRQVSAVNVDTTTDVYQQRRNLESGKIDLLLILPSSLGQGPSVLSAFYGQNNPQRSQVALAIVNRILDQSSFQAANVNPKFTVSAEPVQNRVLNYTDFVVPGMIALSVQQTGLFSVAAVFVILKQRGILRRLMATPMRVIDFLSAQIFTRLLVAALQTAILLAVGLYALHFHFYGNPLDLLLVAVAGSGIFIAIGFAISGYVKNEEAAAPLANLIALPMIFLSGIFFPRSVMPYWLQTITQYLPTSFVADALRSISAEGATLWAIRWNLLGIAAWLALSIFMANRLFRWEEVG